MYYEILVSLKKSFSKTANKVFKRSKEKYFFKLKVNKTDPNNINSKVFLYCKCLEMF